jgi:hypothetical protein
MTIEVKSDCFEQVRDKLSLVIVYVTPLDIHCSF